MRRQIWTSVFGAMGALLVGGAAHGDWIAFVGSQGNLAAEVDLSVSGTDLLVSLINTSKQDVLVPSDVLTAVFFDVSGSTLSLGRTSAKIGSGSVVLFGTTDAGGVVGGEWAYNSGLSAAPRGAAYGISASGLNFFGPHDLFPGSNLSGPDSPGGIDYGLTSAGDDPSTGNTPVTGTNPLIKNRVDFVLSGLPAGFDIAGRISNVSFQYGTSLSEPNFPGTPTPTPGGLAVLALATGFTRRRR